MYVFGRDAPARPVPAYHTMEGTDGIKGSEGITSTIRVMGGTHPKMATAGSTSVRTNHHASSFSPVLYLREWESRPLPTWRASMRGTV